jgi:ABC-type sugar transport system substrate-binding protein
MKQILLYIIIFINTISYANALNPNKTYTVAFTQDTLSNDFRFNQVLMVKKELSKYPNIKFLYSDARSNSSLQIMQIEDFMYQKVDLLIVGTSDETSVSVATDKVYNSGIPVIFIDRKVKSNKYTTYIHPDNKQIARSSAKYILGKINYNGTILLLKGLENVDVTRKRTEAFYKEAKKYKNINVIERTANYLRSDAIVEVDKLLNTKLHFDAIMSQSDSMLVGARLALNKNGIDPSSIVSVGMDYIKEAQDAIKNGKQDSSFLYSLCAKKCAETTIKILSGEKVKKDIIVDTVHITKDNADNVKPIF